MKNWNKCEIKLFKVWLIWKSEDYEIDFVNIYGKEGFLIVNNVVLFDVFVFIVI